MDHRPHHPPPPVGELFESPSEAFAFGVAAGALVVIGTLVSAPSLLRRAVQRRRGTLPETVYDPPRSSDSGSDPDSDRTPATNTDAESQ